MITKVVFPESFDFGMPATSLIGFSSKGPDKGGMEKRAALFDDFISNIERKPGFDYIHVITTGAGERYGQNNNGDYFNKEARDFSIPAPCKNSPGIRKLAGGLTTFHNETFENCAKVYKSHQNKHKNGTPSGYIVKAAYNEPMDRGELIIGVDSKIWEKELQKIASEKPIYLSMAADVPYDTCSYCGNQASRREDYCEHLDRNMCMLTKSGHQIFAINDKPMFHDISGVAIPADKIAFGLRKVAFAGVVPSADLAYAMGIGPSRDVPLALMKQAAGLPRSKRYELLRKLATIEKEITGMAQGPLKDAKLAFEPESGFGNIDPLVTDRMHCSPCQALLGALKDKYVLLPMDALFKMLMGTSQYNSTVAPMEDGIKESMRGMFSRLADNPNPDMLNDGTYEPVRTKDSGLASLADGLVGGHSIASEPTRVRIIKVIMHGKPHGEKQITKESQQLRTPATDYMAGEYAKYLLSFVDGLPEDKLGLTVAQVQAYINT